MCQEVRKHFDYSYNLEPFIFVIRKGNVSMRGYNQEQGVSLLSLLEAAVSLSDVLDHSHQDNQYLWFGD